MDKPLPHLDIEPLFDRVVQLAGGYRVDQLCGLNPGFQNADYYFESDGAFAELKVLMKDDSTDAGTQKAIHDMYMKWAYKGLVPLPPMGSFSISTNDLPDELKLEFIQPFRRTLQGPVKKAGRQLKRLKAEFRLPNAYGILLLVNDGNPVLTPAIVFNLLHHLLKNDHRAIDHVIYCAINLSAILGEDMCGPLWTSATVENRQEVPDEFLDRLSRCWGTALNQFLGVRFPTIRCKDGGNVSFEALKFDAAARRAQDSLYIAPNQFYRSRRLGHYYYCEKVEHGTAHIYLLESYHNGRLIQVQFQQKLIYTTDDYEEVTDKQVRDRLRVMLKKLKRAS